MSKDLVITGHAIQRVNERFGISKTKAASWINSKFSKANFVTVTYREDNEKSARLFAGDGIVFLLDLHEDKVITVYEPNYFFDLREKVKSLAFKELRKIEREEKRLIKRNEIKIAKLEVELAELKLRLLRSRTKSSRENLETQIEELNENISRLNDEINEVKRNKSRIAQGVAAYV